MGFLNRIPRNFKIPTATGVRGVFGGGYNASGLFTNTMDYITISTLGNATDFGDLTVARQGAAGVSNYDRS